MRTRLMNECEQILENSLLQVNLFLRLMFEKLYKYETLNMHRVYFTLLTYSDIVLIRNFFPSFLLSIEIG